MVKKDLGAIWQRKGIRALLMLVPVALLMVIPLTYSLVIALLPAGTGNKVPAAILTLLGEAAQALNYRQAWFAAFTSLLCPMLFLSVPVICSVASASLAFLGEKENGTLETALLSSMNPKSIYNSKVSGCSLLSILISAVSFLVFALTVSVAGLVLEAPFFLDWNWLVLVVLLMPALSFFSVSFVSLVVTRVHSVGEGLQLVGYLLLPFLTLFLAQFAGWIKLNALVLLGISLGLWVAAIVLFNASARRFYPERLLKRPLEEVS